MRKLSEQELDQVKKAIGAKEEVSGEILMEVYDHYVSHLEGFGVADFNKELAELERRFTNGYCLTLHEKLMKSAKKELFNLQWSLFKSYFKWPRIIVTAGFFLLVFLIWTYSAEKTKLIILSFPIAIIYILLFGVIINSFRKARLFKKFIHGRKTIQSPYAIWIIQPMILFSSSFILLFSSHSGFLLGSSYFPLVSFLFLIIYSGYVLTLFEAWKIKSKTALI